MNTTIESINPATLEVLGKVEVTPVESLPQMIDSARDAGAHWAGLSFRERGEYLLRLKEVILNEREDIARIISRENGKPMVEAFTSELLPVLEAIQYYLKNAENILADEKLPLSNLILRRKQSILVYEPLGVIGVIAPYNYPFSIPMNQVVPALMAGNAVVMKSSELTPLVGEKIEEIFRAAKFPESIFTVIQGYSDLGAAFVESGIDKIVFTGSTAVGRKVMETASKNLTPVILELGGKDPMIVCEDADISNASSGAVWGAFTNAGQVCASIERVYIVESIAESFIQQVIEKTKKLKLGNSADPDTEVGPLINEGHLKHVMAQVEEASKMGAEILCGGKRANGLEGNFYEPTVLTGVNHTMSIMTDETFGPVLPIVVVKDENEALQLANDSIYGLTASIWTKDAKKGERLADKLESGIVTINDHAFSFGACEVPWGGIKESGFGATHSKFGLQELVRTKYVNVDRDIGWHKLWWYGYTQGVYQIFYNALDFFYADNLMKRLSIIPRVVKEILRREKI